MSAKEQKLVQQREQHQEAFASWREQLSDASAIACREPVKQLSFTGGEGVAAPNTSVSGVIGEAVQLTGDDGVGVGVGNFVRSQPFSISLWMRTPDRKQRAIVLHRSRAWTDAASRGYELLIVDGKLRWSLIHFWPGNAISIETQDELPLDRWVHVTVTSDGSATAHGLKIYVDAETAAVDVVRDRLTKNITGGGGDTITIGERFRDRGFTRGQVDEFAVFETCLTAAEIAAWRQQQLAKSDHPQLRAKLNESVAKPP